MPYIDFEKVRGDLCYLSLRPTNARIWHKAIFKVGPVAGPKPTRVRQGQKYLRPRRHSPFWRASGNKPNPPERGKSLGDGPLRPKEISSAEAHPAEPPRGKTAYRMQPKNWRGKATHKRPRASAGTSVFIVASHQRTNMAQGRF